jgi:TRAP-type uncharacterized transport system fused permease subunit
MMLKQIPPVSTVIMVLLYFYTLFKFSKKSFTICFKRYGILFYHQQFELKAVVVAPTLVLFFHSHPINKPSLSA